MIGAELSNFQIEQVAHPCCHVIALLIMNIGPPHNATDIYERFLPLAAGQADIQVGRIITN